MALIAAHLNAGHSGGDGVAIGRNSLFHHLHTPFPPFSPSLISLMASVDVKHHVYLLPELWLTVWLELRLLFTLLLELWLAVWLDLRLLFTLLPELWLVALPVFVGHTSASGAETQLTPHVLYGVQAQCHGRPFLINGF